jgi:hypothetical protein
MSSVFKQSEIQTITFQDLVSLVILPNFQRTEDEIHTLNIKSFELLHREDYGYFLFPGIISLGYDIKTNKYLILDGQHRVSAINQIIKQYPEFRMEKINILKIYGSEEYYSDIYTRINMNKKVELVMSRNTNIVINSITDTIKKEWKEFVNTKSKKPQRPNINFDSLIEALRDSKIVEILNIVDPNELYQKLMEINEWYKNCPTFKLKKWIENYTEKKEEKNGKRFFLGLFNRDFEFIRRIILKYRDGIDYEKQNHQSKSIEEENFGKNNKNIWNYFSNGNKKLGCGCCKSQIDETDFSFILRKSYHQGGEYQINNLVIVCTECKAEIQGKNFEDFMANKSEKEEDNTDADLVLSDQDKSESIFTSIKKRFI